MSNANAVIIMNKGKEYMALPGEGGYTVNWSPGTKIMPLHKTESGHYVVACDEYTTLNTEPNRVFVTDYTESATGNSHTPAPLADDNNKPPPLADSSSDEEQQPLQHEEYTDSEEEMPRLQ
jgi:hypothetical protein